MPRPALTRSRIVSAGVSIVSELGLAALDFRTVARRVSGTATGVQRLIGATELVDSVVAQILTSMPQVPTRGDWSRRLRIWAFGTRKWLTGYPGLARYLLENRWDIPVALDRLEDVVGLLDATGLDAAERVMTGITAYWFVLSSADLDESARVIGEGSSMPAHHDSPTRWPRLSAHVNDYSVAVTQAQFTSGLDLLIKGIERGIGRFGHEAFRPAIRPMPRRTAVRDRGPDDVVCS
jgi:hypothetical protein